MSKGRPRKTGTRWACGKLRRVEFTALPPPQDNSPTPEHARAKILVFGSATAERDLAWVFDRLRLTDEQRQTAIRLQRVWDAYRAAIGVPRLASPGTELIDGARHGDPPEHVTEAARLAWDEARDILAHYSRTASAALRRALLGLWPKQREVGPIRDGLDALAQHWERTRESGRSA